MPNGEEVKVQEQKTDEVLVTVPPEDLIQEPLQKIKPTDTFPPEGSKRWKEVYGKMKDFERKNAELEGKVKELESTSLLIDEMRQHNKKLVAAIDNMTASTVTRATDNELEEVDKKITELKGLRLEAREKMNFKVLDEIEDKLDELKEKRRGIKAAIDETGGDEAGVTYDEELVDAFKNFVNDCPWFKEDPMMQGAAYGVDAHLVKDPKWRGKPHSVRLKEVKRIVEERFNYKPTGPPKPNVPPVEDGKFTPADSGGSKVIKLTATQVEIAKGLGLSPEEYARQLALLGKGG